MENATREYVSALQHLEGIVPGIVIFGSARVNENDDRYKSAQRCAELIGEAGISVITGGGPGIMEAANRGAINTPVQSVGVNIYLPHEQNGNCYTTHDYRTNYFFVRKLLFSKFATAFIVYPGGWGTMDELFEFATLMHTNKEKKRPIILADSNYWGGLVSWMKQHMLASNYIVDNDLDYFTLMDDPQTIANYVIEYHKSSMQLSA